MLITTADFVHTQKMYLYTCGYVNGTHENRTGTTLAGMERQWVNAHKSIKLQNSTSNCMMLLLQVLHYLTRKWRRPTLQLTEHAHGNAKWQNMKITMTPWDIDNQLTLVTTCLSFQTSVSNLSRVQQAGQLQNFLAVWSKTWCEGWALLQENLLPMHRPSHTSATSTAANWPT